MNTLRKLLNSPLVAHGFAFVVLFAIPTVAFGAISDGSPDFLPLTTLPGVRDAATSVNLSAFLNSIYGICVGAAAVLAVLQIVRGGITYMLGDSVTEKREARHHIALAVFGLVLVLSPAIVFGVIDPRILNLNVDVSGLTPTGGPAVREQCAGLGTTEGSVVQPDFKHCCAAHGLHPRAQARSSAFICTAEPVEESQAGPGQDAGGNYFINIPTVANQYGTVRMNLESGQQCIHVAYSGYDTQSTCTAATAADERARGDSWITVGSCQRESGQFRLLSGGNAPFCADVASLQP